MRFSILAAFVLAATPAAAHAGDLAGKVFDATALPVAGAVVSVAGHEVLTDADGAYTVTGLAAGEHEVAVLLADGAVQRVWAEVADHGTARRNVFLLSAAGMRGAQAFARSVDVAGAAPAEALEEPVASGASAAWRWRDNDA